METTKKSRAFKTIVYKFIVENAYTSLKKNSKNKYTPSNSSFKAFVLLQYFQ